MHGQGMSTPQFAVSTPCDTKNMHRLTISRSIGVDTARLYMLIHALRITHPGLLAPCLVSSCARGGIPAWALAGQPGDCIGRLCPTKTDPLMT